MFKLHSPCQWLVATWGASDLLNYCGELLGAFATIVAVSLTIYFTAENQKSERKLLVKPCLQTKYIPMFKRTNTIIKKELIEYISYTFNEKENVTSSNQPPHIIKKAEEDKDKGILDFSSFYKENYIIHYTITNVGAGNAINIKFLIDGKPTMPPFCLIANNSKEFIIILSSELLNNQNRLIQFNFEYEDICSLGKYEQHECIEFYREDDGALNTSQSGDNILSISKDL